jgi:hypothetical protein
VRNKDDTERLSLRGKKMKDKRFELKLAMQVKEVKEDGEVDFFDSDINYHDLPYEGVVAIQAVFVDALSQLNNFGVAAAAQMGKAENLSALGLGAKVEAMGLGKTG